MKKVHWIPTGDKIQTSKGERSVYRSSVDLTDLRVRKKRGDRFVYVKINKHGGTTDSLPADVWHHIVRKNAEARARMSTVNNYYRSLTAPHAMPSSLVAKHTIDYLKSISSEKFHATIDLRYTRDTKQIITLEFVFSPDSGAHMHLRLRETITDFRSKRAEWSNDQYRIYGDILSLPDKIKGVSIRHKTHFSDRDEKNTPSKNVSLHVSSTEEATGDLYTTFCELVRAYKLRNDKTLDTIFMEYSIPNASNMNEYILMGITCKHMEMLYLLTQPPSVKSSTRDPNRLFSNIQVERTDIVIYPSSTEMRNFLNAGPEGAKAMLTFASNALKRVTARGS